MRQLPNESCSWCVDSRHMRNSSKGVCGGKHSHAPAHLLSCGMHTAARNRNHCVQCKIMYCVVLRHEEAQHLQLICLQVRGWQPTAVRDHSVQCSVLFSVQSCCGGQLSSSVYRCAAGTHQLSETTACSVAS
jgi:hypothetical protein